MTILKTTARETTIAAFFTLDRSLERQYQREKKEKKRKKRKRTTVQADSQGHVSHYHELMSRVWPVNAYFLL